MTSTRFIIQPYAPNDPREQPRFQSLQNQLILFTSPVYLCLILPGNQNRTLVFYGFVKKAQAIVQESTESSLKLVNVYFRDPRHACLFMFSYFGPQASELK